MIFGIVYVISLLICALTVVVAMGEADNHLNGLVDGRRAGDPFYIVPSEFLPAIANAIAGFALFPIINTIIALFLIFHFVQRPENKFYY